MCECKCHERDHHCWLCDNDDADLCTAFPPDPYDNWEAEGGWVPTNDTPKHKRNR